MSTKQRLYAFALIGALALGASPAFATTSYKFETMSAPVGATLAARLADAVTEQPVINAHVYVIQRQWLPPFKGGVPRFIDRRVELVPDSSGVFAYRGNDLQPGAVVRIVADVVGGPEIEGTVRVNG